MKRNKRLAWRSSKRTRLMVKYAAMTREAVGDGAESCQIGGPTCNGYVEGLHESLTRGQAGGLAAALRDGPPPIPCCNRCNEYVSEHREWAEERGFLVTQEQATQLRMNR